MAIPLPESIATYFEVGNGADDTRLAGCFAQDAVVLDEGRTHRGHEAIRSWLRAARRKYEYSVEPLEVSQRGECVTVAARVTGNFPGSPVQLQHVFQLAGDRIQSLEIH
ncbi:nuclear transport factor 2 family protein [Pseudothauera rhizosphaerae]|uniref:Nuclear transport factor 2 family protein n=1 Tax=Pseudothauera rhizosphaerae TaxID=2565932 RepID=A0A4S4AQY8_9RHOO|nr:nuclear transport factor 2 family protein [Pseudothauera rhizosphaerae]THF62181.1 nuclear transport factor 2 family protein [Pseudothauera rhizosphaerae]